MNAIRVRGLGKQYRIGTTKPSGRFGAFWNERLFGNLPESSRRAPTLGARIENGWLHALRNVTFDVAFGEVLGVMGANGAGKSTLLKILSGITSPSSGEAIVRGRVGALLEIGTGFNYELTGRENVYLNGLTLGMTRAEINRKFDEIVAFSGVENFIDTPVKRYSSGMVTRLGFAVAAHLEPEILIVDEILAVGDAAFQRRCIEKMRNVAHSEGRVVLFISHSIEALLGVCSRAIRLDDGLLVQEGMTREVVAGYLSAAAKQGSDIKLLAREDRGGTGELRVTDVVLEAQLPQSDEAKAGDNLAVVGLPFAIKVTLTPSHDRIRDVSIELALRDQHRSTITILSNLATGDILRAVEQQMKVTVKVPRCVLTPGRYWVDAVIRAEGRLVDQIGGALIFDVLPAPFFGGLLLQNPGGSVFMDQEWTASN